MNRRHYTLIGSALGFAAFLAVGLKAAIAWGGFAGQLLAGGIFSTPNSDALLWKALVVFGSIMAVVGIGGLFAVGGAALGAAVAAAVRAAPEHEHES